MRHLQNQPVPEIRAEPAAEVSHGLEPEEVEVPILPLGLKRP